MGTAEQNYKKGFLGMIIKLRVTAETVALTGAGELNVSGWLYVVWAGTGNNVISTNATATDTSSSGMGVYAIGGSQVTVRENAASAAHGVRAENMHTEVTVEGNVSLTTQIQGAGQAKVVVRGGRRGKFHRLQGPRLWRQHHYGRQCYPNSADRKRWEPI